MPLTYQPVTTLPCIPAGAALTRVSRKNTGLCRTTNPTYPIPARLQLPLITIRIWCTRSSYNPQPVHDPVNHTLTWNFDTTAPSPGFDWENFRFENFFDVPATLSLDYLLQTRFSITPTTGDCDSSNNFFYFSETVIGSHDPNEKDVVPANSIALADSVLTYTIHFQNTGTDSTHFIILKDTLSPGLNAASVRNIASSYKYSSFSISGAGILTWVFNPYRLPDSITNPVTSKGFITFSVNKKPSVAQGVIISNTASVYFDYNTPVVTNTVTDTVGTPAGIWDVPAGNGITVKAFPNPFNDVTNIVVSGINQKFGVELYDVTGRFMQSISAVNNNQFPIHRDGMAAGIYFYRIIASGSEVARGKLVVE